MVPKQVIVFTLSAIIVSTALVAYQQHAAYALSQQPYIPARTTNYQVEDDSPLRADHTLSITKDEDTSWSSYHLSQSKQPLTDLSGPSIAAPNNTPVDTEKKQSLTKDDFYRALIMLLPSYNENKGIKDNAFNWNMEGFDSSISFEYADTGEPDKQFIVAIASYYRVCDVLIVFFKNGSEMTPMYLDIPGKTIQSAQFVNGFSDGQSLKNLFEVTSFDGGGTATSQWVRMIAMSYDVQKNVANVRVVWKYQTVANDAQPVDTKNGIYEYNRNIATYLYISGYERNFVDKKTTPLIVVNETHESIDAKGENLTPVKAKDKVTVSKEFEWSVQQQKFIESEKQ